MLSGEALLFSCTLMVRIPGPSFALGQRVGGFVLLFEDNSDSKRIGSSGRNN